MKKTDNIRNITLWPYSRPKKSLIAEKLADILDELQNEKITYKVGRHISIFRDKTLALSHTKVYFEPLYELLYNDTVRIITEYNYPMHVYTHLRNLIHAMYTSRLAEYHWRMNFYKHSAKK